MIYTGRAGFVDLGQLRALSDLARFVWDQILPLPRPRGHVVKTIHGTATLAGMIDSRSIADVVMNICFGDSVGYEILTYGLTGPGQHNSSFSPEDLCSSYLGIVVGLEAIKAGGSFNAAVTSSLNSLMSALGAQPKAETLRAFNRIAQRWVDFRDVASPFGDDYLKRRNFSFRPWKVGHFSDKPEPSWFGDGMGRAATLYTYTHTLGRTIAGTDFPAEIAKVRADAKVKYGPDYDKP